MKSNWGCPNCNVSSTRRWNIKRHIQTKHFGVGQPLDLLQSSSGMNSRNYYSSSYHASHNPLLTSEASIPSAPSYNELNNLLMCQLFNLLARKQTASNSSNGSPLQMLREIVEFKNLYSQAFPLNINQSQQTLWPAFFRA